MKAKKVKSKEGASQLSALVVALLNQRIPADTQREAA
jgi:hypothetical protein